MAIYINNGGDMQLLASSGGAIETNSQSITSGVVTAVVDSSLSALTVQRSTVTVNEIEDGEGHYTRICFLDIAATGTWADTSTGQKVHYFKLDSRFLPKSYTSKSFAVFATIYCRATDGTITRIPVMTYGLFSSADTIRIRFNNKYTGTAMKKIYSIINLTGFYEAE